MGVTKMVGTEEIKGKMNDIPGPRGLELMRLGMMFQTDALKVYDTLSSYGDIVYCPWPNRKSLFLFHPDQIKYVLKDNQSNYVKSSEYKHLRPLLGDGLLTSEDEKWRQQRRLMAREFHPGSIDAFLPRIQEKIQVHLNEIPTDGEVFDVAPLFSKVTFQIAGDIFFGANVSQFSGEVNHALEVETERINRRMRRAVNLPMAIPTCENRQGKKAIDSLDRVVETIMREGSPDGENVLRKLMRSNPPLSTTTIRDEVMTLLLAGHETTSNLLSWAIWYLATYPEWQDKIRAELKGINKTAKELTRECLSELPILRSVIKETLRLSPSIPLFSRMTKEADVIGGYEIVPGMSVVTAPWITQRDERFWKNARVWDPSRFVHREERKDDYSFFPFAKGARSCIGEELAMVEGMLILAGFLEHHEWRLQEGFHPKAVHHLTLKSENGVRVRVNPSR